MGKFHIKWLKLVYEPIFNDGKEQFGCNKNDKGLHDFYQPPFLAKN